MPRSRSSEQPISGPVLLLVGIALLLIFAKVLLIPLAFALTLSFLLVPAVSRLEKRGVKRSIAVALASTLTCACLVVGLYAMSRQIVHVAGTIPAYRANIEAKMASLHSSSKGSLEAVVSMLEDVSGDLALTPSAARADAVPVRVVGDRSDQLHSTVALIGTFLEPIGQIGVVFIFAIYMLMNREDLRHRLLLLAGMGNINVMTRALEDATTRISKFLVMQFQVNACYGVLFGTGLYFLHVPAALLWAVVAGTLRIVPFVGTLLGLIVPLLLSVAVSASWWPPLLVLALFLVLELTLANLIEPWLFSERTGISSLALLGSAIFWSMIWGGFGLVLSTPLTVCVVVLGRYVPQLSFLHSLLGTNAKLSPAAHMYERLLAMDQREAWAIADRYIEGKSLVKLYDSVLIPVLGLAEEDRHRGALEEIQSKFVLLSLGELVARMTSYHQHMADEEPKSERSLLIRALRAPRQKEFAIVCIAADDEADELTTVMLTQLLEREGYQTLMLAVHALSDEILQGLAAEKDTVVFISALPPFAFAQARAVCKRMRMRLPDNRIAVALWNSDEDGEEVLERFGSVRPSVVLGRLAQALLQVETWKQGTLKT